MKRSFLFLILVAVVIFAGTMLIKHESPLAVSHRIAGYARKLIHFLEPVLVPAPTPKPIATPQPVSTPEPTPGATPIPAPSPAVTPKPDPLAWLLKHRESWPKKVALTRAAEFPVVFNGKIAGSMKLTAGTIVDVVLIELENITASHGVGTQRIPIGNTDLAQRATIEMEKALSAPPTPKTALVPATSESPVPIAEVYPSSKGPFTGHIPDLIWKQRSDWINVKTHGSPAAIGDGKADDTEALQAALDQVESGTTLYLPPGIYRITKTLDFDRKRPLGVSIIGHGRSTTVRWDGAAGGRMFWSHGGAVHTRYVGITWDGNNKAAVGFCHDSRTFETEVLHLHEAFMNMTDAGIRIGQHDKSSDSGEPRNESAELEYTNCLFENCRRGVAYVEFNDYDNTFDGCEFRHCAIGIQDIHGNTYARDCHFEESSETDISLASEHSSSVRRCTSTNSNRFIDLSSMIATLTIQDCHVSGWKADDGAIQLKGGPTIMMDCSFSEPARGGASVWLVSKEQQLISSNNTAKGGHALLQADAQAHVIKLPDGERSGVIKSASQHFLKETVALPEKMFDAKRGFGAKADGSSDDTKALQQAIDAARHHGDGAVAYLPAGVYLVSDTLKITGANYTVAGSGLATRLVWKGDTGGVMMSVIDPDHVVLENINVGSHDAGAMNDKADILHTSSGKPSHMTYNNVAVFGMYQKKPDERGLRFSGLSAGSIVHLRHLQGNIRFTDSAQATILADTSYEGSVTVEGKDKRRDGFLGFQMRLTTLCTHSLYIRDNHSIVMSDLYVEQADNGYSIQGGAGDPEGRIVIQGAKLASKSGPITIDNYGGTIFLGHNEYYGEPKPTVISHKGTRPLDLILAANMFYNTALEIRHEKDAKVSLICNQQKGKADGGGDTELKETFTKATAARMLDDLRRLGEVDLQLNYPEIASTGKSAPAGKAGGNRFIGPR